MVNKKQDKFWFLFHEVLQLTVDMHYYRSSHQLISRDLMLKLI